MMRTFTTNTTVDARLERRWFPWDCCGALERMPITIPPEEEAVPKRPKNVEAIPASQWGQIASRLQAQGIGGPEVTRTLDEGDGVKALARFVSRRLKALSGEPNPAAARLLTPQKRGNHDVRERPQTPPLAYLGGFDITLDDLFIEIEALRVALKAIEIFRNAGGFADSKHGFDDRRRIAALLASGEWGRHSGQASAEKYESILASYFPWQQDFSATSSVSSLFEEAMRGLKDRALWGSVYTQKPLIAVLDQLREQLGTLTDDSKNSRRPQRDYNVTDLLLRLFQSAPGLDLDTTLYFTRDRAKNLADCIVQLRTQLEYIHEQLVNAKSYADALLTALPNPHTMAHTEASRLVLRMIEENRAGDVPQNAQEASAEVHIHDCRKALVCVEVARWYSEGPYMHGSQYQQIILENIRKLLAQSPEQ